ncbi:hypothetical protein D9613_007435 [Agrocybe pediades]|uniref:Uncharacterized protein n=1 Tax=Agrocybe pediades TaxID=84607 RepID=A0A8H4QN76_9AGAR|nr:hypothetical protein D9613_007435 [Agrocybe pediades]
MLHKLRRTQAGLPLKLWKCLLENCPLVNPCGSEESLKMHIANKHPEETALHGLENLINRMAPLETSRSANEATVGRPLRWKMVVFGSPERKDKSESKKGKRGRKGDKENRGISVGNASTVSPAQSPKRSPPRPVHFVNVNEWNKQFTVTGTSSAGAPTVAKRDYRDVIFRYAAPDDEDFERTGEYYQLAAAKYDNDLKERLAGEPDNDNAILEVDSNEVLEMDQYINWPDSEEEGGIREYWYGP